MTPTVLHLFAGSGGCTLGFQRAGFRSLGSLDFDQAACRDLKRLTGGPAFCRDLASLENVPRIQTRGAALLAQIVALLQASGYATDQRTHDCGELGGLAQHRLTYRSRP